MTKKRGLTVLETLFAIAIMAVLLALFIPAVHQAMKPVHRARCVSNLKQIGVAVLLYAGDHNGRLPLPYSGNYPNAGNPNGIGGNSAMKGFVGLFPYLSNSGGRQAVIKTFYCPGSSTSFSSMSSSWANQNTISSSYSQYCGWGPDGGNSGFYLNSRDAIRQDNRSRLLYIDLATRDSIPLSNHRNSDGVVLGANALYVGGSVSWVPVEELTFEVRKLGISYLFPDPYKNKP